MTPATDDPIHSPEEALATAADRPEPPASGPVRTINLALQGGGAHGAFTWGVLDRLLEDRRLAIEGLSGTSAGAVNAAVLASGYATGGSAGARAALDQFWHAVASYGRLFPLLRNPWDALTGRSRADRTFGFALFDMVTRWMSPYQFNPLDLNPLRDVLARVVDFQAISSGPIKLFVAATNVRSGNVKVFQRREITVDSILASTCLPTIFQAVEIDGEAYWDGGYMGNPCIFPLIYGCNSRDVVLVQINPMRREEVPRTAREIMDRLNEITFNAGLMREMRAIHFVSRLVTGGHLDPEQYKQLHVHMIADDPALKGFGSASKLNADLDFLLKLRGIGRAAADRWLEAAWPALGRESTIDLRTTFL